MRATTRFLLLGAFSMCLSACLPEPPMGGDAAIFKRPSRYGWGASGRRPGQAAQPQQQQTQQQQKRTNRFGDTENKRKPDSGSSSQNSGGNSRTADSGSSSTSDSGSSSSDTASSGPGNDDDDKKKMTDGGSSTSNSGGDSSGGNSSGGGNSSASTPPSNLNEYPYARLVPGKKGYVTLPGANAGVGEIDVTGIKPGTPVEINDPRDQSKKIYFRVP